MAKVYISKSIFPNKALNAFISCVSKHSLKQEFSSAVLREGPLLPHLRGGRACLTLLPSLCAAPSILFPGGIEAVGTFRISFVPALFAQLCCKGERRFGCTPAGWGPEAAPRIKKWGWKAPPSRIKARSWFRAVITAVKKEDWITGLKRKNAIKNKRKREVEWETEPGWVLHGWIAD